MTYRHPRRRAASEARQSGNGRTPPAFKDWLRAQLANPSDERLRPFLQQAWDEMEISGWREPKQ